MSRAASKETLASRGCCMDGEWRSSPLRKDEVLIRQRETTRMAVLCLTRIHCGKGPGGSPSVPRPDPGARSATLERSMHCVGPEPWRPQRPHHLIAVDNIGDNRNN